VEFHGQISITVGLVEAILAAWLKTVAESVGRSYTAGMAITISPELEGRIQRVVASGRYATAELALQNAVHGLEQEDADFGLSAAELQTLIDVGWAEAERGETMSGDEARVRLAELRATRQRG
jgi:Arc/MetJ-type ribon-helix-helix transcriptional regulator